MPIKRFLSGFRYLNWLTLRKTIWYAYHRRLTSLSAEMAFHSMLALFPAILALLRAIGMLENFLESTLPNLARDLEIVIPKRVWELLVDFARDAQLETRTGWFSLNFLVAIWIASGALSAAMNALDQIHHIPRKARRSWLLAKLVSLILTVGTLLLLVTASFVMFIGNLLVELVDTQFGAYLLSTLWHLISPPVTLGLVAIAFASVYRFGTSRWQPGRPVALGATLAAISWAIVSYLFSFYFSSFPSNNNYERIYGAVGAVIALMLWLYMSSLIMLLGDQFNATVGEFMAKSQPSEDEETFEPDLDQI